MLTLISTDMSYCMWQVIVTEEPSSTGEVGVIDAVTQTEGIKSIPIIEIMMMIMHESQ